MGATYQLAPERRHISLSPSDTLVELDCLQTPTTTFTALLSAAQSVVFDTSPTANKCDATPVPDSSVTQRRLRNRASCRKTRLKRKLEHHALEILARERKERHDYLTKLSRELREENDNNDVLIPGSTHQAEPDELFREFAARSLHYALVDREYHGWRQVAPRPATTKMKQKSEEAANPPIRISKRLRRASDISTAPQSDYVSPQFSLIEQWRPIVDGLKNVDLKLHRMKENNLGGDVFDRYCYWKFVGVNSVKMQRDGEITAVVVSGTTRLRFHGRLVQEVNISSVLRKDDGPFDFATIHNTTDEAYGNDKLKE